MNAVDLAIGIVIGPILSLVGLAVADRLRDPRRRELAAWRRYRRSVGALERAIDRAQARHPSTG